KAKRADTCISPLASFAGTSGPRRWFPQRVSGRRRRNTKAKSRSHACHQALESASASTGMRTASSMATSVNVSGAVDARRSMAPIVADARKIKSFRTEAALAAWMKANHARETELWLKIHKKGSGLPTVTHAQALDVALCWGWIDGIRKSFDDQSFLQRYT